MVKSPKITMFSKLDIGGRFIFIHDTLLWRGDRVTWHGKFVKNPHPPIFVKSGETSYVNNHQPPTKARPRGYTYMYSYVLPVKE